MQKLHACFWLKGQVEEAANFYAGVFGGKVTDVQRAPEGTPGGMAGHVMTAHIDILGQTIMLLNFNSQSAPTEAFSFVVNTKDQAETDRLWTALTADGGQESMCGWLKDKYGYSWQITPERMGQFISGPDRAGAERAMKAMLGMRKIVLADIEKAYAGG
jgi:predicted 3-demethylubiquinone-9 3-methyltransferase (glyoxalase superfamily)